MQKTSLLVSGVVQGVGFRPFCVRTACALGLCGTVRNTPRGVEIVLEGKSAAIEQYIRILWEEAPSAAVVADVQVRSAVGVVGTFTDFTVLKSPVSGTEEGSALIPADLAVCDVCLAEMNDPANRRWRYPFINCTDCGPRYTIIEGLPYDRSMTTMRGFTMCPECAREYRDPADRRYHAQPNACPVCGPEARLADASGNTLCEKEEAIRRVQAEISAGRIVAVKGLGGFHIACLPEDGPLKVLRERKRRPDKPFALMVRDTGVAERLARFSSDALSLLRGARRPVVLCPVREGAALSSLIAPGQKRLGLMLPYTPLHHLLMEKFDALIMTSANVSDAPIVSGNEEAFSVLAGIADFFLCHDRDIHTPVDDSVVLPGEAGSPIFLRRARGYVPNSLRLPFEVPDILAAGAQLKATYTAVRRNIIFPGQYLGDLDQLDTAAYYRRSLSHFVDLYGIRPRVLAFDKHPGYAAAELAESFCPADAIRYSVQHHHAHFASVLLDNRFRGPAVGVIFDGTGYGDDGTIWGGEFFVGDIRGFQRVGSLRPFLLPGGERAIREPWRCALALLCASLGEYEAKRAARNLWPCFDALTDILPKVFPASPVTTSCGRLFDGVSALLNLCPTVTYDGQAAMTLENAALDETTGEEETSALPFDITEEAGFFQLDWRGAVRALVAPRADETARLARAFHRGLAGAVCAVCERVRDQTGTEHVALSGGVWQNRMLTEYTLRELERRGFIPLTHREISPNDEGVSVGQAAVAAYNLFGGDI